MKKLIILRGWSGSGKSTVAKQLASEEDAVICSADQFMIKDGEYRFDFRKLGAAHERCKRCAEAAMKVGDSPIVIDNTNIRLWEMQPYVAMGLKYGYEIEFCVPGGDHENIHGVPSEKVQMMKDSFEHFTDIQEILEAQK